MTVVEGGQALDQILMVYGVSAEERRMIAMGVGYMKGCGR